MVACQFYGFIADQKSATFNELYYNILK